MAQGNIRGYARLDPARPQAQAVCDRCGAWYSRVDLVKQMEFQGPNLSWTGLLVCTRTCLDRPQPQLRPIRLPPDPVPISLPRPESFGTLDNLFGFTAYAMWAGGYPLTYAVVLEDGSGNPILFNGQELLLEIGSDGPALLAQLQSMTGIAVPGTVQVRNGSTGAARSSTQMMAARAARSYVAIFNPCQCPIAVSLGGAAGVGVYPSINLGEGGCLFWATAQSGIQPYAGALSVSAQVAGVPFYAFEAP